ncbi:hypothetical protein QBC44DRAFT_376731 [Cladorrhinum sp. PSN332]|nr:hypothetical protein QBC44DRAFT_376731 [Cladorrhinum sp. PSN332]
MIKLPTGERTPTTTGSFGTTIHSSAADGAELSESASDVPRGTVEGRLHQLDRRGVSKSDPQLQRRLWQRDRESQLFGWGQKLPKEACFVRPATHSTSIEIIKSSQSVISIHPYSQQDSQLIIQHAINMSSNPQDLAPPSASSSRLPGKLLRSRELSSLTTGTTGTQSSITTTPTGRRLAARQLFEQYGISRPSEPHSVGVGRKRKRVCHVCGDQVVPQSYCTTCGHPMCGRCRRAESGNGQPVVIRTPVETVEDTAKRTGARHRSTESGVSAEEMMSVSAAVATGSPTTVVGSSIGEGEESEMSSAVIVVTGKEKSEDGEAEGKTKPAGVDLANVGKRHSVKLSPFIIADQAAKVKPQVTTIHVIATPPSKPPKYDIIPDSQRLQPSPSKGPSTGHQQQTELLMSPPSSQVSLPSPTATGSGTSSAAPRSPARSSAVASPVRSPAKAAQSPPVKNSQTPSVLRRVQVLAQQSGQDPSQAQQVLTVDVESSPAPGSVRGAIPRVRVTSPPAWLKGAGMFAPIRQQPTVRRRWNWEDKGSNAGIDAVLGGGNVNGAGFGGGGGGGSGGEKGRESSSKSSMATVLEVGNRQQRVNDGSGGSERSPKDGASPTAGAGFARLSAQNLAQNQSQTQQVSPSAASRNWSQLAPSFWKLPPSTRAAQDTAQRKDTVLRPKTSSRGSEVTTITATGTEGTSVISEEFDVQDVIGEEDDDDVGIQGLTIVLHLKGKDDLVISTDLTNAGSQAGLAVDAGGVRSSFVGGGGGVSGEMGIGERMSE